jgi:hypothetical protein
MPVDPMPEEVEVPDDGPDISQDPQYIPEDVDD